MSDKLKKKKKPVSKKNLTVTEAPTVSPDNLASKTHPKHQEALPIPDIDRETVKEVGNLVETSYLQYMALLQRRDTKDKQDSLVHLNNLLSEYLGPYILIGYSPDDEPIEVLSAKSSKDREAVMERLRKTFIRHMNS